MTVTTLPSLKMEGALFIRLAVCALLYAAQGLSIGFFFFALPAWLAARGFASADTALVLSAAAAPWAVKIVSGFLVDRYPGPERRARRHWILSALGVTFAAYVGLTLLLPPMPSILLLAVFAFLISAATSVIDVATDALAIDSFTASERPRANGAMFGGQVLGTSISTILSGMLLANYGLATAVLGLAAGVAFIGLIAGSVQEAVVLQTEAPHRVSVKNATSILFQIFGDGYAVRVLLAAFLMGCTGGLFRLVAPHISVAAGWSETDYTSLAGQANLVSGLIALMLIGSVVRHVGEGKALMLSFMTVAAAALFLLLSDVGQDWIISAFVAGVIFAKMFGVIALGSLCMEFAGRSMVAMKFAFCMSFAGLGLFIGPLIARAVDAQWTSGLLGMIVLMSLTSAALIAFGASTIATPTVSEPTPS